MWLLMVAVVLALLKTLVQQEVLDVAWLANLSWWWVIGLFGLTAAWWGYADASGMTRRRADDRVQQRRLDRIEKNRAALRGHTQRKR